MARKPSKAGSLCMQKELNEKVSDEKGVLDYKRIKTESLAMAASNRFALQYLFGVAQLVGSCR